MSIYNMLQFGEFARTVKAIAGVKLRSLVQIAGVGVKDGKLQYSAVVVSGEDKLVTVIGPYPSHCFHFEQAASTGELIALVEFLTQQQSTADARTKLAEKERRDADERVPTADETVYVAGAIKKKTARKRTKKNVDERYTDSDVQPEASDNSHNWGFRGRINQRAKDDLAATAKPPKKDF
jgi:hypothetical protein